MSSKECVNCPGAEHSTAECPLVNEPRKMESESRAFEAWRNAQVESLRRMGCAEAADAFYNLGSVQWAGWQARASLAVSVPEGWKLVPVGLTNDMRAAMMSAKGSLFDVYRATISAAPTAPTAPTVKTEQGTTSDQYRAELYDEVWQKARDMGYGNVTDALVELERLKQSTSMPAAGSAVEGGPDITTKHGYPAYSVAQHARIVAALSAPAAGTVTVPRELLERISVANDWADLAVAIRDLRALLAQQSAPELVKVPAGFHGVIESAAVNIAYAVFNLTGKKLEDLKPGLIETTDPADSALIAERELRALLTSHQRGEA